MSGYPYGQFNEDHIYASHSVSPQQQQPPQLQQFQQHQQTTQEPPGAYPQWETLEQLEHQHRQRQDMEMAMHSPLDLDLTPMQTPTSASFQSRPLEIDLDDSRHTVPSQASPINDSPIHLVDPHMMHQQALAQQLQRQQLQQQQQHQLLMSRPGSSTGPLLFSNATRPPTPGPSTSANLPGTAGAVRSSSTRDIRAAEMHPYHRHSTAPPLPGGVAAFLLGTSSSSAAPSPAVSALSSKAGAASLPPRTRKPSVRFSQPAKLPTLLPTSMAPRPKSSRSQGKAPAAPPVIRLPFTGSNTDAPQPASPSSFGTQGKAHSPQTHSPLSRGPIDPSSFAEGGSPSVLQDRSPLGGNLPPRPSPHPPSHPTSPTFRIGASSGAASQRPGAQKTPLRSIPADMYYSLSTRTLRASLEVPGVQRENVRVTMGTCYFNRIKYVCVVAESDPVFPWAMDAYEAPGSSGKRTVAPVREEEEEEEEEGENEGGGASEKRAEGGAPTQPTSTHLKAESPERTAASAPFSIPKFPGLGKLVNPNLRERRFGTSRRVIQVPATTTLQDIDASLQDGVLTLTIHCGEPFEGDDELVIPVR